MLLSWQDEVIWDYLENKSCQYPGKTNRANLLQPRPLPDYFVCHMKKLYTANHLLEAHIIRDLLENAYIPTRLFNEYAQGGTGEIPFTHTYPEVWVVRALDFERGRKIIAAYEQAPQVTDTVSCPQCGEENPGNFQLCWQCGGGLEVIKEKSRFSDN